VNHGKVEIPDEKFDQNTKFIQISGNVKQNRVNALNVLQNTTNKKAELENEDKMFE